MAKDNGHCACFIVPEHLFQSLAQSDEVDDASRGLASKAIQQMQELDIANKVGRACISHNLPSPSDEHRLMISLLQKLSF